MLQNKQDRRQLSREIWEEVFQDTPPFLDLYFSRVYHPEETDLILDYKDNQALAHTGRLSFFLRIFGERIPASYISGAATRASHRGQGLMPQLLHSSHTKMYQQGKVLSFLIPAEEWLYSYYHDKMGYASVCYRAKISNPHPTSPIVRRLQQTPSVEGYLDYRKARKAWLFGHIEHTYPQWCNAIYDAVLSGGGYLSHEGILRYVGTKSKEQLILQEQPSSYHAEETIVPLSFSSIASSTPSSTNSVEIFPHGMLRAINIPRLLSLYAKKHPSQAMQFDLFDPELVPNTGRYRIQGGTLLFHPYSADRLQPQAYTPNSLLEEIFSSDPIYIDLMLD